MNKNLNLLYSKTVLNPIVFGLITAFIAVVIYFLLPKYAGGGGWFSPREGFLILLLLVSPLTWIWELLSFFEIHIPDSDLLWYIFSIFGAFFIGFCVSYVVKFFQVYKNNGWKFGTTQKKQLIYAVITIVVIGLIIAIPFIFRPVQYIDH